MSLWVVATEMCHNEQLVPLLVQIHDKNLNKGAGLRQVSQSLEVWYFVIMYASLKRDTVLF
jgi:hypothetical protein